MIQGEDREEEEDGGGEMVVLVVLEEEEDEDGGGEMEEEDGDREMVEGEEAGIEAKTGDSNCLCKPAHVTRFPTQINKRTFIHLVF